jgi:hypothetical protein
MEGGDFDWMPGEKLKKLASALREYGGGSAEGQEFTMPPAEDSAFWRTLVDECEVEVDEDDEDEEAVEVTFARDVRSELDVSGDYLPVNDALAVGDLGVAESRLLLAVRQVKSVVYIASHEMESLWTADGLKYHTLRISPASEPHRTLASQLSTSVSFLRANSPSIVCSSCPKLRAVVVAAYLHHESGASTPIEAILDTLRTRGILAEPLGAAEWDALHQFVEACHPAVGEKRETMPIEGAEEVTTPRVPSSVLPTMVSPAASPCKRPPPPVANDLLPKKMPKESMPKGGGLEIRVTRTTRRTSEEVG